MSQLTLNLNSRWRLARLARALKGALIWGLRGVGAAAAGGGLLLIYNGTHQGWSLIGVALSAGILDSWYRLELQSLPSSVNWSAASISLDEALSAGVLAALPKSPSIKDLWIAALKSREGIFLANHLGLPITDLTNLLPEQADGLEYWQKAMEIRAQSGAASIDGAVVLAAINLQDSKMVAVCQELKISPEDIMEVVLWSNRFEAYLESLRRKLNSGGIGRDWASGYTPILKQFGQNVTQAVEHGFYRSVPESHQSMLDTLIQHLGEGQHNDVVLIGEPGSGKTETVYALADRLIHSKQPGMLAYHQIISLDASTIIASGGSLENTLLNLFDEASSAGNIILFLDEAQLFFSEGVGALNLSQLLLPLIQRNVIRLIMAMTPNDWQRLKATSGTLASQLTPITIPELGEDEASKVVEDEALQLEGRSGVPINLAAVRTAIKLSGRYVPDEALPGRAIKLLESALHHPEEGLVTDESVKSAVEGLTGTKVASAGESEKVSLLNLEQDIHKRMVNQSRAVSVVSGAIRRARAGVANPKRPLGSFLFLGPTGVGKTELAKALAHVYFGGTEHVIRLDMSEYQQSSDTSRLLTSKPSSPDGSNLAFQVREQPFSLVLLDEIEKAHPDILNLLLQILDEGHLTDDSGHAVSFRDAIIIATSNAAADDIRKHIQAGEDLANFEDQIIDSIIESHQFRQELLNRFDEIVLFRPLTKDELLQVVDLLLDEVNQTLHEQKITIKLTDAAKRYIVDEGFDPRFGARPMRRMMQRTVQDSVAQQILSGKLQPGHLVELDVADLKPAG